MPTTFTIKQVPDALADRLRERASANRRSLQKELQAILEDTVEWESVPTGSPPSNPRRLAEPSAPAYLPATARKGARSTLDEIWQRARRAGLAGAADDDDLLEKAAAVLGSGERPVLLREGLKALIEREAARRLIQLGGSVPGARRPPRRRSALKPKHRQGGA